MSEFSQAKISKTVEFLGLRIVDGGDSIALRFRATDGNEMAVYVPRQAASIIQKHLAKLLPLSVDL